MFNLFKKKEIIRVYIPEIDIVRILKAWDAYLIAPRHADSERHYTFWYLAENACPELQEGEWQPHLKNKTNPYFEKVEHVKEISA